MTRPSATTCGLQRRVTITIEGAARALAEVRAREEGAPPPTRAERRRAQRAATKARERAEREEREVFEAVGALASGGLGDAEREALVARIRSSPQARIVGDDLALWFMLWVVGRCAREMLATPGARARYLADPDADFTRDGKIPLDRLLLLLMAMGGGSLSEELHDAYALEPSPPTTQAFCQRRALLTEEAMRLLFRRVTDAAAELARGLAARGLAATALEAAASGDGVATDGAEGDGAPRAVTLGSLGIGRLILLDGSDVNAPPDPDDEETRLGGDGADGWNQLHLNAAYDVGLQMFVEAELQPKRRTHETGAAARMIRDMSFDEFALVIADRGYGCLNLVETIRRAPNLHYLIRVKEGWIKELRDLPMEELDRDLRLLIVTSQSRECRELVERGEAKYLSGESPYGKEKVSRAWDFESGAAMEIRVVRLRLSSGRWETLVTSLPREAFPPGVLAALYHQRWTIETAYLELKWHGHLAQMHTRSCDLARQEIWARLAMHNLVSAVIAAAESLGAHEGGPGAGHRTVPERKFATVAVRWFLLHPGASPFPVTRLVARRRVPVRRGRPPRPRRKRSIGFRWHQYR